MLVSLVIPVYNSEKYLKKCLESVKRQNHDNLQIILVDDGSTDKSGIICDQYATEDCRFVVVHKKNAGVSVARNVGISIAKGRYIGFIDSDDYIEDDMISNLIELSREYDSEILMCGCFKENSKGVIKNRISKGFVKHFKPEGAINAILDKNEFNGYACNKLFSADLIHNNKIFFDENIHTCEDLLFCCECILKAKSIIYDSKQYYHYVFYDVGRREVFNYKKMTALTAYEKIIDLLTIQNGVNLDSFKISYIKTIIALLLQSMEKKDSDSISDEIRVKLRKFNVSELTDKKTLVAYWLVLSIPYISFVGWKIRRSFSWR